MTEKNGYDTEGRISDYTLTLTNRSSYPMQTSYSYDTANRLTQITYPAQYGIAGTPRKTVTPSYDQASRLTQLNVNSATQLSELVYNPMGQVTSLKTGASTGNPDVEQYSYDGQTGLLTNQKVIHTNTSATLLDLSYEYNRGNSVGNLNGKTGQLTHISNNLDHNKDRSFEFDALGRLKAAKGGLAAGASGVTANWTQTYAFDRYGNKTSTTATGITADSNAVPTDGLPTLTYDTTSNRINTTGYQYDNAGNMIRGQNSNGVWQKFEYDAAGRLVKIKDDSNNVLETYTYGADRSRLANTTSSQTTYYAWGGSSVIEEYTEATGTTIPVYSKAYVYAGHRLLSTATNIGGSELLEFHHPDRLGTKMVSNPSANSSYEQSTLPFGTELTGEELGTVSTNQRFTSYDRSGPTGLDYAVNRTYSSGQGRFTQVDPSGKGLNLFAYVGNNPIDFVDPSGLNEEAPLFNDHIWTFSDSFMRFLWFIMTSGGGGSQGPVEHSGGGGGGNPSTGPKDETPKIDDEKFRKCVGELFHTTVDNYEIGKSFNGHSPDATNWFIHMLSAIVGYDDTAITTRTQGRSSQELSFMRSGLFGQPGLITGLTYKNSPQDNFVTNDIGGAPFQESMWVYELGNSLGFQTDLKPQVVSPDRYGNVSETDPDDVGGALVDCVYGGRITPEGRLQRPISRTSILQ